MIQTTTGYNKLLGLAYMKGLQNENGKEYKENVQSESADKCSSSASAL